MRILLSIFALLFAGACAPISPTLLADLIGEENVRQDLRDSIKHRLSFLGPEQQWHYNCLFQKPIAQLEAGEQSIAFQPADALFRAYWEEERQAWFSAGTLYRRAADDGMPLAFARLGRLLVEGLGTAKNSEGGVKLLLQSARLDCAEGQWLYADFLSRGVGVRPDLIAAWVWSEQARLQGHQQGRELQQRITGLLGPSQLALAQTNAQQLRGQLDRINKGADGQELVRCQTARSPRTFITRMRACHTMGGTHTPY